MKKMTKALLHPYFFKFLEAGGKSASGTVLYPPKKILKAAALTIKGEKGKSGPITRKQARLGFFTWTESKAKFYKYYNEHPFQRSKK